MGQFGRKNTVITGLLLIGFASFVLALSMYVNSKWGFYLTVMIARVFQGGADAIVSISIFSIGAIEFDD
jgi:MFS family permease